MPIADIDIWRTVHLLTKQHGKGAAMEAARRADEMLERCDIEGKIVWRRVLNAIHELQRAQRELGEAIN